MELVELKKEREFVETGNLRDNEGQYGDAIAAYDSALMIDPTDADALFAKGITLKKMGRPTDAANCADMAIGLYCGR